MVRNIYNMGPQKWLRISSTTGNQKIQGISEITR